MGYTISIGWRLILFEGNTRLNLEGEAAEDVGDLPMRGKEGRGE